MAAPNNLLARKKKAGKLEHVLGIATATTTANTTLRSTYSGSDTARLWETRQTATFPVFVGE